MKKQNTRGFTLTEMLVTTLILGILGVGLTTGITSAIRIYHSSVFTAESQLLSATVDSAVSDVLRYARFDSDTDGTVHFSNDSYRVIEGSLLVDGRGQLCMNPTAESAADEDLMRLLGESSYSSMKLTDFTLRYDFATHVFSGSYRIESTRDAALNRNADFAYRTLAA